jgi:hypothetical protein
MNKIKTFHKIKCLVVICISLNLLACAEDPKKSKQADVILNSDPSPKLSNNLNISLLLDLSDRINPVKYPNPSMEYYIRDAGYIGSVSDAFVSHIRGKKIQQADDRIQLYFDPEPSNSEINSISNQLKFHVTKQNLSKDLAIDIDDIYSTDPLKIYELAIKDDHYVGSDTWKFFKNKINSYCIEDGYRNILVVLTDGYIYHENSKIEEGNRKTYLTPQTVKASGLTNTDWKDKMETQDFGFIKANDDLSNLEVLVLGINPSPNNPFEEDVIKAYWTKWFNEMNVKRFEIKQADLPSNMEKVIKDFVLAK